MHPSETNASAVVQPQRVGGYLGIGDYAAIGDGHTVALVGMDGSIDWLCLPRLDSPSVFGALLDSVRGGSFVLAPAVPYEVTRRYLPQTNVLQSDYTTAEGAVRVVDVITMDPYRGPPWRELARKVEGLSGAVPMRWRLSPRFEYGKRRLEPACQAGKVIWRHGALQVSFNCWDAGEPHVSAGDLSATFTVHEGDGAMLALLASEEVALPTPSRTAVEQRLNETVDLWRGWVRHTSYQGPWKEAVERSLLAIGLLSNRETGAVAAAATTSLPEAAGGGRNYDYRFCWVRDLSLTADALMGAGMGENAHASVSWLLGALSKTHPRVDPVYTLSGEVLRSQRAIDLAGYMGVSPVHVGNKAGAQLQLGCFGDLLETVSLYAKSGHLLSPSAGERLADCADVLCAIWRRRDAGFWELDDSAHYMTSKMGCWAALDRLLGMAGEGQAPARRLTAWRAERGRIRRFIETHLWSESRGSYLMKQRSVTSQSEMLDCGALLAARRGFSDPKGPRMEGTIAAIRSELEAGGPLLFRYSGMQEEENAFLACSFWMAEALALAGRSDEAAQMMDGMVSMANDVGLYSEELEPQGHAMRGNFPQALSHLALIRAAAVIAPPTDPGQVHS